MERMLSHFHLRFSLQSIALLLAPKALPPMRGSERKRGRGCRMRWMRKERRTSMWLYQTGCKWRHRLVFKRRQPGKKSLAT